MTWSCDFGNFLSLHKLIIFHFAIYWVFLFWQDTAHNNCSVKWINIIFIQINVYQNIHSAMLDEFERYEETKFWQARLAKIGPQNEGSAQPITALRSALAIEFTSCSHSKWLPTMCNPSYCLQYRACTIDRAKFRRRYGRKYNIDFKIRQTPKKIWKLWHLIQKTHDAS